MSEGRDFPIGNLIFVVSSGELRRHSRSRRLEPKAASVLALLCAAGGAVVSRQELLDSCWGNGAGSDEALTQTVAQIRRAFDELGASTALIETLSKRGYRVSAGETIGNAHSAGPLQNRFRSLSVALLVLTGAFLAVTLVLNPHAPIHAFKHAFGLGPPRYDKGNFHS